jgi:hypothetical protein
MTMTTAAHRAIDHARTWSGPGRATALPSIVVDDRALIAFRRRRVVALGALASRHELDGERLVSAYDLSERPWWVPAAAVWSDADRDGRPEHPWHVGLATDTSWHRAVLSGLSDRLGWEAKRALDRGLALPRLNEVEHGVRGTVWDGRLGHEVPTVVITSDNVERWGAGTTADSARRRALYGDQGTTDAARQLADMELVLATSGIDVGVVDLATPLMTRAGVARVSVQLLASTHDPVRRWDAGRLE